MTASSKKIASLIAVSSLLTLGLAAVAAAQTAPTARVQRSEQLIRQEKALRDEIDNTGKSYIKKVVIQGPELPGKELQDLAAPYKNRWLSDQDIATLEDSIRTTYVNNGYEEADLTITHETSKSSLNIVIDVTD